MILKLDLKIMKSKYKTVEIYKKLWLCFAWCLAACRIHGNAEKGECVAEQVLEQENENDAGYVCSPIKHVCS